MKRNMFLFVFAVLAATLFFNACTKTGPQSLSDVVKAAYSAANKGNFQVLEKQYITSQALMDMGGEFGERIGGMQGIWDVFTKNRTLEKIEILKEETQGEETAVFFKLYFRDGSSKEDKDILRKENGLWKITMER